MLLFVGGENRGLIGKHKRTTGFTVNDFDILITLFSPFQAIVSTTPALTELDNLARLGAEGQKPAPRERVRLGLKSLEEINLPSKELADERAFATLGLTDVGIGRAARNQNPVLTVDHELSVHLAIEGVDCINFNL